MDHRKPPVARRKLVWRISERAPLGEWVDPSVAPAVAAAPAGAETPPLGELPEVSSGGWIISSFDLLHGTDISEDEDTVPGDLLDELFRPVQEDPRRPKK